MLGKRAPAAHLATVIRAFGTAEVTQDSGLLRVFAQNRRGRVAKEDKEGERAA